MPRRRNTSAMKAGSSPLAPVAAETDRCNEWKQEGPRQLTDSSRSAAATQGREDDGPGELENTKGDLSSSACGNLCCLYLSRTIRKIVKSLRSYLADSINKYEDISKMLNLLEDKLWVLELDDMDSQVKLEMKFAHAVWIWELSRLVECVSDMVELISDESRSSSDDISHWLSVGDNLLSMKYEIGSLTSICGRGESFIEIPSSTQCNSVLLHKRAIQNL